MSKPALLLHVCCAPCSTHCIQALSGYSITAYFYGPNIHPEAEYELRLSEAKRYMREIGTPIIEGDYDTKKWFDAVRGYENEPEGGRRCEICYRVRLEGTAQTARKYEFEYFTTTLSISPHKDAHVINSIGEELGKKYGVNFYNADFKKDDGFRKSVELSRKHRLYRQNYCGCIYSFTNEDE